MYVGHSPVEDFRGVTGLAPGCLTVRVVRDVGKRWESEENQRGVGAFQSEDAEERRLSYKFWNEEERLKVWKKRSTDQICTQLS
jgi:hypothetical protein